MNTTEERIVVIFGAGASSSYGLPTLSSLPQRIKGFVSSTRSETFQKVYSVLYDFVRGFWSKDIESDWIDLEQVLGSLDYLVRTGGAVLVDGKCMPSSVLRWLYDELPKLIFASIDEKTVQITGKVLVLDDRSYYRDVLNEIWAHHRRGNRDLIVSAISFNYDCLLDDDILDHMWPLYPPVQVDGEYLNYLPNYLVNLAHISDTVHLATKRRYPWTYGNFHELIKPHGSFDWLICGNCGSVHNYRLVRSFITLHDQDNLPQDLTELVGTLKCTICGGPLEHRLVAPILGKTESAVAKTLWQGMFRSLAKASHIYVVGYSFPPSDVPFRLLLSHALNWNSMKPSVTIVNPSEDEALWDRVSDAFPAGRVSGIEPYRMTMVQFTERLRKARLEELGNKNA